MASTSIEDEGGLASDHRKEEGRSSKEHAKLQSPSLLQPDSVERVDESIEPASEAVKREVEEVEAKEQVGEVTLLIPSNCIDQQAFSSSCSGGDKFVPSPQAPAIELIEASILSEVSKVSEMVDVVYISKAAARMRKYRFDHREDPEYLRKESVRKRTTRAKRKAEALHLANGTTPEASDEAKEMKEPKEPRKRARVVRIVKGTEVSAVAIVKVTAAGTGIPADTLEYSRKEAERARKYRALKRNDPVWKERDALRMRKWRLKRKGDVEETAGGVEPVEGVQRGKGSDALSVASHAHVLPFCIGSAAVDTDSGEDR